MSVIIEFGGLMFVIDDGGPSGKYRIVHGYMQDRGASGGLAGACLKRSPKTEIARYRLNGKHRFYYSREAGNVFSQETSERRIVQALPGIGGHQIFVGALLVVAIDLGTEAGLEDTLDFEEKLVDLHGALITKFGWLKQEPAGIFLHGAFPSSQRAGGARRLGAESGWANTSRYSFSSSLGRSRCAAAPSSSAAMVVRMR